MEALVGLLILVAVVLMLYPTAAAALNPPPPADPPAEPPPAEPPPAGDPIQRLIGQVAEAFHEDPILMKAICRQESNFDPYAVNESDPSYGIGQIMPLWVFYFKLVPNHDIQAAIQLLLNPARNLEVQAMILTYFRRKGFRFPEQVDIYNVGETLWAQGRRNVSYQSKVAGFYRSYGGGQ